jgi:hypothetical protein
MTPSRLVDGSEAICHGSGAVPFSAPFLSLNRKASRFLYDSRELVPRILRPERTPTPFSILRSPVEGPLLIVRDLHPEAPIEALAWGLRKECRVA